jgi:isoleucyl-tRNA synthetase
MISNSQPWDNLKFDTEGLEEVHRKLFSTLYNTYTFFALYANVDGFTNNESVIEVAERPEIDRWIISCLNTLIKDVEESMDDYEPTKAARAIMEFVNDQVSNWYVRLSRRRFWKTDDHQDKLSAYQTLHTVLKTVAQLMSPIAPFYSDWLFRSLSQAEEEDAMSVHLEDFPVSDNSLIDKELEKRMEIAQQLTSLVLSLRKKESIKVRQPLAKILVPVLDDQQEEMVKSVQNLIMSEVNVKNVEFIRDTTGIVSKKVKPNFKLLGKKVGGKMKEVAAAISEMNAEQVKELETNQNIEIQISDQNYTLLLEEVEIIAEDIEGWLIASDKGWTVALDITITEELMNEGYARELVNKIQNQRKENNLEVTDKILIKIINHTFIQNAILSFKKYICNETLATDIMFVEVLENAKIYELNDQEILMDIQKISK